MAGPDWSALRLTVAFKFEAPASEGCQSQSWLRRVQKSAAERLGTGHAGGIRRSANSGEAAGWGVEFLRREEWGVPVAPAAGSCHLVYRSALPNLGIVSFV